MPSSFLSKFLRSPFAALREREEKRRRNASWNEAYALEKQGKFREAAAVYRKLAEENRTSNELIFSSDLQEAIKLCLRAGDVATAMKDARAALALLAETGWLESHSDGGAEELSEIVGDLFVAGYSAQAEAFFGEINARVAVFGWSMPRPGGAAHGGALRYCPHCNAQVGATAGDGILTCEYCGGTIPAVPSP